MSIRLTVVIAVAAISAGSGAIAGHVLWRAPQTPQQVKVERQKCERLLAQTQSEAPAAAPPSEVWGLSRLESEFSAAAGVTNTNEREKRISAIFEHVDPAHIPELAAAIAQETPSQASSSVLMRLVDTWSNTDPEAALKFTSALPTNQFRESMIMSCFMHLANDDPASAESYIGSLPANGQLRSSLSSVLLDRMVQEDPAKALEFVAKLPPGAQANESAHVYAAWATTDPEGASAAALKLPKGSTRNQALNGAVSTWIYQDPGAALDFVAKQGDQQLFMTAMEQAAQSAATDHPDLIARYLDKIPAGSKRDEMLETFASQWATADLANAKAWAMSLRDSGERDQAIAGLVRGRGNVGGDDSTDLLAEIRNPQMRARAAVTVCETVAQNDPNAGLRCAAENSAPGERDSIVGQIFGRWADNDPRAAADAVGQMKDPPQDALRLIGQGWAAIDPKAALQWAEGLPAGDQRSSVVAAISSAWAETDPRAAAELADRENSADMLSDAARIWARADPQAAMGWLQNRRSEVGRDGAIDTVLATWSGTDEKRLLAWANDLPSGGLKDRSLQHVARRMAYESPDSAAGVLMSMSGPTRTEALAELYSIWKKRDADGAATWLAGARLSDRERDAISTPETREEQPVAPDAPGCVCPGN